MKKTYLIAILAIIFTAGCKTITKTEYVDRWHNNIQKDSIYLHEYLHDTTSVYFKGDTVYIKNIRTDYKTLYKDRLKTDTLVVKEIKTDTVFKKYIPKWVYWYIVITFFIIAGYILIRVKFS